MRQNKTKGKNNKRKCLYCGFKFVSFLDTLSGIHRRFWNLREGRYVSFPSKIVKDVTVQIQMKVYDGGGSSRCRSIVSIFVIQFVVTCRVEVPSIMWNFPSRLITDGKLIFTTAVIPFPLVFLAVLFLYIFALHCTEWTAQQSKINNLEGS